MYVFVVKTETPLLSPACDEKSVDKNEMCCGTETIPKKGSIHCCSGAHSQYALAFSEQTERCCDGHVYFKKNKIKQAYWSECKY